jgi:hypothetical protein
MAKQKLTLVERFWLKVEKTETCWLWKAQLNSMGYGVFTYHRKRTAWQRSPQIYSHRLSWMFENGQIPEGMCVLHQCDTPACCNPSHLFLGTRTENSADMVAKSRQKYGEHHFRAKLTDDEIRQIRNDPRSSRQIAPEFGVQSGAIRKIRQGIRWKHVV